MPAKRTRLTPAARVVQLIGGIRPLARVLDIPHTVVNHWLRRGGHIPAKHQRPLLDLAKRRNVALTADDLIA